MPKIDLKSVPTSQGSSYPTAFANECEGRSSARLSLASAISQFGVNLVTLEPGSWSSQRHWHEKEDEFVYVLSGQLVLVEDEGETVLEPGDAAAWKAGVRNGHHLQNRGQSPAQFLAIGSRDNEDWGEYPDIDLRFDSGRYAGGGGFSHKDGTKYPKRA